MLKSFMSVMVVLVILVCSSPAMCVDKYPYSFVANASTGAISVKTFKGFNGCVTGVRVNFRTPSPSGLIISLTTEDGVPIDTAFPSTSLDGDDFIKPHDGPACYNGDLTLIITGNTTVSAEGDVDVQSI